MKKGLKISLIFLPIGVIAIFFLAALESARGLARQRQCISNLKNIGLNGRLFAEEHSGNFPANFQAMADRCTNLDIFVCPGTHHKPGFRTNVNQWSDYQWVLEGKSTKPQSIAAYCIPEHHDGKFGVVLFYDGSVEVLSPADFLNATKSETKK